MTPWLVVAIVAAVLLAAFAGYAMGFLRGHTDGRALVWSVIRERGAVVINRKLADRLVNARARLHLLAPAARWIMNAPPGTITRERVARVVATIETALDGKAVRP